MSIGVRVGITFRMWGGIHRCRKLIKRFKKKCGQIFLLLDPCVAQGF